MKILCYTLLIVPLVSGYQLTFAQVPGTKTQSPITVTKPTSKPASTLKPVTRIASLPGAAEYKTILSTQLNKAAMLLGKPDGFLKSPEHQIGLPDDIKKVETNMRALGLGKLLDDATTSLNRTAEDAMPEAKTIYQDIINKLLITDPAVLNDKTNSASASWLKKNASANIQIRLTPVIEASLNKTGAVKKWKDLATVYGKISPSPLGTDLTGYVTGKVMKAIFAEMAK